MSGAQTPEHGESKGFDDAADGGLGRQVAVVPAGPTSAAQSREGRRLDLSLQDPELENITAEQTLRPGYYWTAKSDRGSSVSAGETLLLLEIIEFEQQVHSVKLLLHPRRGIGNVTILVDDFLASFDPCYEAEAIRAAEQQSVLDRVAALQDELVRTQSDQTLMIEAIRDTVEKGIAQHEREAEARDRHARAASSEKARSLDKLHRRAARRSAAAGNPLVAARVGAGTSLGQMIDGGLNAAGVEGLRQAADRQVIVATAQAGWLTTKTEEISKALKELAPYAAEKSQLALARSSDAVKLSQKLRQGIESLDLYTGTGVEVFDVRVGVDAPTTAPLMLVQGKRFMEEELAVHADVGEAFDWRNKADFFRAIETNDDLLNQVFPSERCVVSMAVTRHQRHYDDAFRSVMENIENQAVFLLVRNGGNVSVVYSATPSHEAAARLFPTEQEMGEVFRGVDGERITLKDVEFGKHSKRFDDLALHYRRFLILMCGLDHRLKLFGDFYPASEGLSFMSRSFQERYMRFYADDEQENLLTHQELPWVDDWIKLKNSMAQPGSRVYVGSGDALRASAPEVQRRRDLRFKEWQFKGPQIVLREGTRLYLSMETTDGYERTQQGPAVKCYLDAAPDRDASLTTWWICVDDVKADDVHAFIHSRRNRAMGVGYLRLFRRMEHFLREEAALEAPARAYLLEQATTFGGMPVEVARPAVDTAVRNWRAARRGAALPTTENLPALNEVLDLVTPEGYVPPAIEQLLEDYVNSLGPRLGALVAEEAPGGLVREPLMISRTGKNRYVVYTTTDALDRDPYPSVLDWRWVRRVVLEPTKTCRSLKEVSDSLVWMGPTLPAAETEIRRWDGEAGLSAWLNKTPEPIRLKKYAELKTSLAEAAAEWGPILRAGPGSGMPDSLFDRLLAACAKKHSQNRTSSIAFLRIGIPVGLSSNGKVLSTIYFTAAAEKSLHLYGDQAQKERVIAMLKGAYWREATIRKWTQEGDRSEHWHLVHTSEELDVRHDEAVKDYISGAKNDAYWMGCQVQVNHKRTRGNADRPGKKGDGKPRTYPASATFSLNRAFDELAGVGPILRRRHFKYAASRTRSWDQPESVRKLYRNDPTPEEALAYRRALADYNRSTRERPYVLKERCNLSALVWDERRKRSVANGFFTAPLLNPRPAHKPAELAGAVSAASLALVDEDTPPPAAAAIQDSEESGRRSTEVLEDLEVPPETANGAQSAPGETDEMQCPDLHDGGAESDDLAGCRERQRI